jgi:hypothetical protein
MNEWIDIVKLTPPDNQAVDVWSASCGRCTNCGYVRNIGGKKGNNFFVSMNAGPACIRDATHWMRIPEPPKD